MTDYELITAVLAGEQEFFGELVNRYKNLVYSIIIKQIRDREEAHDLSQDVFIKVYKNLGKYTPEYKFSTWIMRITSNHLIDMHRKRKIETISYEEYTLNGASLAGVHSPEAEIIKREQSERIEKIVSALPEVYKTPISLYHDEGLSYQEIADKINEPLSKIKNRIFRGRKILKSLLAESEV
ncbi:MAG: sigma-70 family RNA polymerase sigma factor [Defluviitaleaceae bacterium]|nr:sigma-70 family RNA polymerase sigma factor [Defluviitaleaceae bacterium]